MNASVIYASLTGNNEEVAEIVVQQLKDKGLDPELTEISQADAEDLEDDDLIVIVPYTDGEGELPDEGMDFYDDIQDLDLTGKVFGVTGSGDTFYGDDYCKAVTYFDKQIAGTGATRGAEPLFINLQADYEDKKHLDAFTDSLLKSVSQGA